MLSVVPALGQDIADQIMAKGPVDVSPLYKQVTAYIVSDGPSDPLNLGAAGELFPAVRWSSGIRACRVEDDKLIVEPEETFTIQFAPGLRFEARDYAIYGGLNPAPLGATTPRPAGWGQDDWAARQVTTANQDVHLVKRDLLAAVMPLVDAAAATGADTALTYPAVLAFTLFGQGVAYFQGTRTLITGRQPAEGLPLLRGLVTIAARFEQMTEEGGEGLGLVIRLALDAADDELRGQHPADTASYNLLQAAASYGLSVPDKLRNVESSRIWRSLAAEMQMARHADGNSFGIAGFHLKPASPASIFGFDTGITPGPFTDLITSACVIAQVELLENAAPVFGWTTDTETISKLKAEARELNERAAHSE
jgi:hypothetical protein